MEIFESKKEVSSADQIDQLNALRFETQTGNKNLPREKRWNFGNRNSAYVGKFRKRKLTTNLAMMREKLILGPLGNMGILREFLFRDTGGGGVGGSLVEGDLFTPWDKPISVGYAKTGAYVGENRKSDGRSRVKCFQEFSETNSSAPAVQLQRIMVLLSVIAYWRRHFRAMDVFRAFLRSGHLQRETYLELPDGVRWGCVVRYLSKPMRGLSTACKGWSGTILGCLDGECGGVTSMDKSVFFRNQQGLDYEDGERLRDPNRTNLGNGILKAGANFETGEKRKVSGIIDIHVDDLLIPGGIEFTDYISWKCK